ncbi:MAG: hypothetical protein ACXV7J_07475 [Methylomonas sp.]
MTFFVTSAIATAKIGKNTARKTIARPRHLGLIIYPPRKHDIKNCFLSKSSWFFQAKAWAKMRLGLLSRDET